MQANLPANPPPVNTPAFSANEVVALLRSARNRAAPHGKGSGFWHYHAPQNENLRDVVAQSQWIARIRINDVDVFDDDEGYFRFSCSVVESLKGTAESTFIINTQMDGFNLGKEYVVLSSQCPREEALLNNMQPAVPLSAALAQLL